ncbi:unnamed protein product [Brassicogethes aeneus]|uniref:Trichohyalin-plectin-homology domain-containing protein n=1 Tax=Brassicogethes aeneus TaxID=1431903 RepID=A0A9P0FQ45_BRAAE|nr:unnamed protein product [Brassicogethes aeneus]
MESRFYYFPGQTPENTKISDRSHALHLSQDSWKQITGHLDRNRLIQEAIDKNEAHKKALKDGSDAMTKTWENSVENIRKRKEEERLEKIRLLEENKFKGFYKLRVEQEEKRQRILNEVNQQIFTRSGYARQVNFALLSCEVLKEQSIQKEHLKQLREQDEKQIWEEKETIMKGVEDEKKEKAEEAKKLLEKNKAFSVELKKIIDQKQFKQEKDKLEKIKREAKDNIEAAKQIKEIEEIYEEEKRKKQLKIKEEVRKDKEQKQLAEFKRNKEASELDDVIQIYKDAKFKIDCYKKMKEKELQDLLKDRSKLAVQDMINRNNNREKTYQEICEEIDLPDMQAIENEQRRQLDAKIKQDIIEDRKVFLAEEEIKKLKEQEIKKWEILNRFKTDEVTKEYVENYGKKEKEMVLLYRKALLEQMEENKEKIRQEKEEECLHDFAEDDAKFLKYANETLEIAKKKCLPTKPIEQVIKQYKKENFLLDTDQTNTCHKNDAKKTQKKNRKPCKCCRPKKE